MKKLFFLFLSSATLSGFSATVTSSNIPLAAMNFSTDTVMGLINNRTNRNFPGTNFSDAGRLTQGTLAEARSPHTITNLILKGDTTFGQADGTSTKLTPTVGSRITMDSASSAFTTPIVFSGTNITAGHFTGGGENLTGLNASQLTSGTVPPSALTNVVTHGATNFGTAWETNLTWTDGNGFHNTNTVAANQGFNSKSGNTTNDANFQTGTLNTTAAAVFGGNVTNTGSICLSNNAGTPKLLVDANGFITAATAAGTAFSRFYGSAFRTYSGNPVSGGTVTTDLNAYDTGLEMLNGYDIKWASVIGTVNARINVATAGNFLLSTNLIARGYVNPTNGILWQSSVQLTNIYTATATLDFASQTVGVSSEEDLPIAVPGAAEGDGVELGVPATAATGIIGTFTGYASNSYVYVRFISTGTAQNPPSATFRATVKKYK